MTEVYHNLFIGTEFDCTRQNITDMAVVHACKDPCHRRAVGYSGRSLPKTHPNYLTLHRDNHLYLNIIDPPGPLFMPPLFTETLEFIANHINTRKVLIHCNLGESRAPSLALLYLAKRTGKISNLGFNEAKADFKNIYPGYQPGNGIQIYLRQHWEMFF